MKIKIPRQLVVRKTSSNLLEAISNLQVTHGDEAYMAIHSKYSKIRIQAMTYREGVKKAFAYFNVDPSVAKQVSFELDKMAVAGNFSFSQTKIIEQKRSADGKKCETTKLSIGFQEKDGRGELRRAPMVVTIENGWSTPEPTAQGGLQAKKGTYEVQKEGATMEPRKIVIYMTLRELQMFFRDIAQHIVYFEQAMFPHCLKQLAKLEAEEEASRTA